MGDSTLRWATRKCADGVIRHYPAYPPIEPRKRLMVVTDGGRVRLLARAWVSGRLREAGEVLTVPGEIRPGMAASLECAGRAEILSGELVEESDEGLRPTAGGGQPAAYWARPFEARGLGKK
jgi:hypothetical protein